MNHNRIGVKAAEYIILCYSGRYFQYGLVADGASQSSTAFIASFSYSKRLAKPIDLPPPKDQTEEVKDQQ
jgi:hypothetical protein